jgi:hypothetical protein
MRFILPFLFSLYYEYVCFPMLISCDCLFQLLERTLSYYCKQCIIQFAIKIVVVVYKLVKQLSLTIVVDICY